MSKSERKEWKLEKATDPLTSPNLLAKLATDDDRWVRYYVAQNLSAPPDLVEQWASDADKTLRKGVAERPSLPLHLLTMLADDAEWEVRAAVARNSSTPAEVLARMRGDEEALVNWELAQNPSSPLDLLTLLAQHPDEDVRQRVVKNPSLPAELLAKLAEDSDSIVRLFVAHAQSTPTEVLEKLLEDENADVRAEADAAVAIRNEAAASESESAQTLQTHGYWENENGRTVFFSDYDDLATYSGVDCNFLISMPWHEELEEEGFYFPKFIAEGTITDNVPTFTTVTISQHKLKFLQGIETNNIRHQTSDFSNKLANLNHAYGLDEPDGDGDEDE